MTGYGILHVPAQRFGSVLHDQRQFLAGVELEPKYQLHTVTKGLEQAELIGRAQQQTEVGERNRLYGLTPADDDLPLIEGKVKGRLMHLLQLMGLVHEHDLPVPCRKQQSVQVTSTGDALAEGLMALDREFLGENGGDLRFARARRADQQAIIQPLAILEGGIQSYAKLSRHRLLANNVREGSRSSIVNVF